MKDHADRALFRSVGGLFTMEEKKISMKISAVVTAGDVADADEKETLHMASFGKMSLNEGKVEIRYHELFGDNRHIPCVLSFNTEEPEFVCLTRGGEISSVMMFSEGKRLIGTYNSDDTELEFIVVTQSLRNGVSFEKGGTITLSFHTEMQGIIVQSSKFRFDIRNYDKRLDHGRHGE